MNDPEAIRALQSQPLNVLVSADYSGLVSAACNGVWLCPRYRDMLHICRESLVGNYTCIQKDATLFCCIQKGGD